MADVKAEVVEEMTPLKKLLARWMPLVFVRWVRFDMDIKVEHYLCEWAVVIDSGIIHYDDMYLGRAVLRAYCEWLERE